MGAIERNAEEQAKAALIADDRDATAPLQLVRRKAGQSVSFRCGDAFIKVYTGANAPARAARAQAAQQRASAIIAGGAPLSPRPGPVVNQAFAMDWLAGRSLAQALGHPFAPRRRLLTMAGEALRAAQADAEGAPLAFGGWPAKRMRAIASETTTPPWPEFHIQAQTVAEMLWAERESLSPAGFAHGDCHVGNMIVRADGGVSLIDFDTDERRPVIWDIANFLISIAAHTPRWRGGERGALGLPRRDSEAFLAAFPQLAAHERLLTLHMLRFALRRGAATGAAGGWSGGRFGGRRARLAVVAGSLHRRLGG